MLAQLLCYQSIVFFVNTLPTNTSVLWLGCIVGKQRPVHAAHVPAMQPSQALNRKHVVSAMLPFLLMSFIPPGRWTVFLVKSHCGIFVKQIFQAIVWLNFRKCDLWVDVTGQTKARQKKCQRKWSLYSHINKSSCVWGSKVLWQRVLVGWSVEIIFAEQSDSYLMSIFSWLSHL